MCVQCVSKDYDSFKFARVSEGVSDGFHTFQGVKKGFKVWQEALIEFKESLRGF